MKINVIDSIMGSGKTTCAINKMNSDVDNNYIYITPFLSEVTRIKESCVSKRFVEPINFGKGKQDNLHYLISEKKNIVSTHALFRQSNSNTLDLLKSNDYILVLDEVMDVIEQVPLGKNDIDNLIELKLITIKDSFIKWNEEALDYDGRFNDIKTMALNDSLIYVNNCVLLWNFPVHVFEAFKEVWVLTYLFKAQIQKYYYDLFNVEYNYFSIGDGFEIIPYEETALQLKKEILSKINILDNSKMNAVGNNYYSLSSSWFKNEKNTEMLLQLKKNITNYFINILHSKKSLFLWTTFKDSENKISHNNYKNCFIAINARATNDYQKRTDLAYCANIFLNPIVSQFFIDKNITVLEEQYALSEMLQWIWRSAIRNKENINLYIPSIRMRNLLIQWGNK